MHVSEQLRTSLSDRYHIDREIGAGGMATVYLAEDVRHHRRVALKVLRPELAAVLGPERFLSEINVTANLQHPHLLPLFDSGEADGLLFYVMPYVEGETLRHRLTRERQLPIDEAVRIAVAIASALDYAHRHNVIHRDLKPENILLHEGQPLITDFGIALAVSNAGGARVTQTGLSLGTPQYMSPEQATGDRVIDARSDIYSLGAVVYEMLVGEPPHMGTTVQAIIAKVLTERAPDVRVYRETVPAHVAAAVQCALAKLPADRFATAGAFADALTGARLLTIAQGGDRHFQTVGSTARPRWSMRELLPWGIAAALLVFVGVLATRARTKEPVSPTMFEMAYSDSVGSPTALALSPDGSQLAYTRTTSIRLQDRIFLRRMDRLETSLLTAGSFPAFSPDGAWIVYTADDGKLKKVPVAGGAPIVLFDSSFLNPGAPSWGDNGQVLFVFRGALRSVAETGGPAAIVAQPDSQRRYVFYGAPAFLPGGRAALVTIYKPSGAPSELGVVTLPQGKISELGVQGNHPRYVAGGYIVFGRPGGSLFAAPFSLRRRRVTGPAVSILDNVGGMGSVGGDFTDFTIANNGTLMYRRGGASELARIVGVGRNGAARPLLPDSFTRPDIIFPRVSPDGRRVALSINKTGSAEVWVYDRVAGTLSRVTSAAERHNGVRGYFRTEWTADGQRIVYASGDTVVWWQPWDGSGSAERYLGNDAVVEEISLGPPHTYNVVRIGDGNYNRADLWLAPVDSPTALRRFLATSDLQLTPRVSPDGQFVAYTSTESGANQVYVRPLPGPGSKVQVSISGGTEPVWARDGKTLFYRGSGHMMAASIAAQPQLEVVRRDTLFVDSYVPMYWHAGYDVLPNGEFVMVDLMRASTQPVLLGVAYWTQALRERMRATK